MAKSPPGDFKVITPANPLLSKQVVTSKGIPVPYTNLQLNPYPRTCSIVTISHFQCTAPSTWITNCADSNTQLDHQLEKDVGCKVFQFITWWRSRSFWVTKPCGVQTQQLLQELWQIRFPVTLGIVPLCNLCYLLRPLK